MKQSKEYNVKPTEKQKKAFDTSVENGGNISKAMREVGYSDATAKTPQKLTESRGWEQLVEEYLPDDLLARVHKEGLQAVKGTGENVEIDMAVRHKYLDTAYKLKGSYSPEKKDITTNGETIKVNSGVEKTKEEVDIIAKYHQELIANRNKRSRDRAKEEGEIED